MASDPQQPTANSRRPGRPRGGSVEAREQLLEAGRDVFAERGYGSAGARDIVARVGVTAPVLYHHFGSKAGLFAAALKDVNDQVLEAFEAAVADNPRLLDRIDSLLDVLAEFTRRNPPMARFVVAAPIEYARHPELSVASSEMARLNEFVHRMCEGSESEGVSREHAEAIVLTMIYGISRMAASPGRADHAARHVSTAVEALKLSVRGELFGQPAPAKRERRRTGSRAEPRGARR